MVDTFDRRQLVPRADRLKPMCVDDDLYAKVSRSNIVLRSKLKACNTLRCLTMFENESRRIYLPPNVIDTMRPYRRLSESSPCVALGDFINGCRSRNRRQLLDDRSLFLKCKNIDIQTALRRALFHFEIFFMKGICIIYDGLNVPGHAKRCSGLSREFSTMHFNHLRAVQGLQPPCISRQSPRSLSYGEKQTLMNHLDHDRMLYGNYGRQNAIFVSEDNNFSNSYGGELIDETVFVRQGRHKQSTLKDWTLCESENKHLLLGGIRSPCPNGVVAAMGGTCDYVGKMIRMFCGVFESEWEKEQFYVECMLRRLSEGNEDIDVLNCISVCRMLSVCRSLLDDYGRRCDVPRSVLRVDEDFHYMRGKWGANDHEFKTKDMAWPTNSVFLQRNLLDTRPLKETLTLTFTAKKKVEMGPLVSVVRGSNLYCSKMDLTVGLNSLNVTNREMSSYIIPYH